VKAVEEALRMVNKFFDQLCALKILESLVFVCDVLVNDLPLNTTVHSPFVTSLQKYDSHFYISLKLFPQGAD